MTSKAKLSCWVLVDSAASWIRRSARNTVAMPIIIIFRHRLRYSDECWAEVCSKKVARDGMAS